MKATFAIGIESARNSRPYTLKDNVRVDSEVELWGRSLVHVTAKLDWQGKPVWEVRGLTASGLVRIDGSSDREWISTRHLPR